MRAELQRASGAATPAPDEYRITSPAERLALLIGLRDSAAPVLMHAANGAALRSRLWVVDGTSSRLVFALGAGERPSPQLQALLEADEVTAVAHPGHVKLQFDLHGLVLVRGATSAVLQCGLPDELLRFQRRETFRVCPPVSAPVAYLRHPAIPDMSLALRVLDLSLGGCALRLPDDVPALEPGTQIGGVTIELDLHTRLRVALTLQHVTHLSQGSEAPEASAWAAGAIALPHGDDGSPGGLSDGGPGGHGGARLGCEWRLQRLEDERTLQRWIDQAQVRQRLGQRGRAAAATSGPSSPSTSAPATPAATAAGDLHA